MRELHTLRAPGYIRDALAFDNKPFFIGRQETFQGLGGTTGDALTVEYNPGTAKVITKLLFMTPSNPDSSPQNNDIVNLNFIDALTGGTVRFTIPVFVPNHNLGASPLQGCDHYSWVWEPRQPIIVPPGWRMEVDWNSPVLLQSQTLSVMPFGYAMDPGELRTMGYDTTTANTQASRNLIQSGAAPASNTTTVLAAARAGYGIYISDILMILSPTSANATVELETSSGANIFRWVTGAITGIPIIKQVKCRIFLQPDDDASPISNGIGLQVTNTNSAGRFSIAVIGSYIRREDIPDNAWWANASVAIPTASQTPTLGRTLKTAPGKGRQLICEGFDCSIARDGSEAVSVNLFALTYGTSFPGSGDSSNISLGGNVFLTAPICVAGHDQHANIGIGEVQMPCQDNAALMFESQGGVSGIGTPAAAGDIVDGSVTVWGRTEPTKYVASSGNVGVYQGS